MDAAASATRSIGCKKERSTSRRFQSLPLPSATVFALSRLYTSHVCTYRWASEIFFAGIVHDEDVFRLHKLFLHA